MVELFGELGEVPLRSRLGIGVCQHRQQRHDDAERTLRALITDTRRLTDERPHDLANALYKLALVLHDVDRDPEAAELLREAITVAPSWSEDVADYRALLAEITDP